MVKCGRPRSARSFARSAPRSVRISRTRGRSSSLRPKPTAVPTGPGICGAAPRSRWKPMYRYDGFDAKFVAERAAQFRRQVTRRLAGELTEDQFRPLRLMNGLYLQLHAYMLRVNVPYGTLSSKQMRTFAHVARTYHKGFGHFTTRQNIQYNWIKLEQAPDIIKEL